MSRIAYVNGRYMRHDLAHVHVEDRGYQFSDGVYEVAAVYGGGVIDEEPHLDRLERSLRELRMESADPAQRTQARDPRSAASQSGARDGMVYLQVTRGAATRDHPFPEDAEGAVVLTARSVQWPETAEADRGAEVVSIPDSRWGRCDVKSVSLLPNVLAKQEAREQGAYEAWLIDPQGRVTEGSSTNAWIVDDAGRVVTRDLESNILGGITRQTVIRLAQEAGIEVAERAFTLAEAQAAPEAFLTSTTSFVRAIVRIDGQPVGTGEPGPVTLRFARSLPHLLPWRTRKPVKKPRAVLFDWDNTLVESWGDHPRESAADLPRLGARALDIRADQGLGAPLHAGLVSRPLRGRRCAVGALVLQALSGASPASADSARRRRGNAGSASRRRPPARCGEQQARRPGPGGSGAARLGRATSGASWAPTTGRRTSQRLKQ